MYLVLLGPPGAGKGTQGALLAKRAGLVKIATGDLLRAAVRDGTPLGQQAKGYMDSGQLVPDEVVLGLIDEVLAAPEARHGVIMDGFPRTVAQAEAVDQHLDERQCGVDLALGITVPRDELIRRLRGRADQEGRSDDTPEAIRARLGVYEEETAPLIAYYKGKGILAEVDGVGTVEEIAARIDEALGQ